jgi:hypothetical protein
MLAVPVDQCLSIRHSGNAGGQCGGVAEHGGGQCSGIARAAEPVRQPGAEFGGFTRAQDQVVVGQDQT